AFILSQDQTLHLNRSYIKYTDKAKLKINLARLLPLFSFQRSRSPAGTNKPGQKQSFYLQNKAVSSLILFFFGKINQVIANSRDRMFSVRGEQIPFSSLFPNIIKSAAQSRKNLCCFAPPPPKGFAHVKN
ncbi:MAG: hypothetical protein KFF46_05025, partial [Desulfobacterales bacterium]|nr:hypothetical protein [Desulfobacterales bacterium]